MRALIAVLAFAVVSCQQTPRYTVVARGERTLRMDTQTGETHHLEGEKWVKVAPTSPPPESSGLSDADLAGIRVSAVQADDWLIHVTIDNGTRWNLTGLAMSVSGFHINAGIPYGRPVRSGKRLSFAANLVQQYPPSNGTSLTVKVLGAEGHLD